MKNLEQYITENQGCTFLEDFVINSKEWKGFESGTRAFRVDTYSDNGSLVNREYVLKGMDNKDEVLEDMQHVGCGYYTSTFNVKKA